MLKHWYRDFPQYPRGHIDFWRVKLISHLMLFITAMFVILALINFFVFASPDLGILDSVGAVLAIFIYKWFRKTGKISIAAWVTSLMVSSIAMIFICIVEGQSNSFMWATIAPPVAFFLLGRNWGSVVTAVVLLFCCYIAFTLYVTQAEQRYSLGSVLNVIEVSIAHILMFRFYEGTRSDAYNELTQNNKKIQVLADTDKLTGLFNREKLDESLLSLLSRSVSHDVPLALLIMDIDHFNQINDKEGHLVGDKVLKSLANRLQSKMRTNDILARWGGEEFVIVLPNTDIKAATELSGRLLDYVRSENIEGISITVSIGVTQYNSNDSADSLFSRADKALYQAKDEGRNRVVSLLV